MKLREAAIEGSTGGREIKNKRQTTRRAKRRSQERANCLRWWQEARLSQGPFEPGVVQGFCVPAEGVGRHRGRAMRGTGVCAARSAPVGSKTTPLPGNPRVPCRARVESRRDPGLASPSRVAATCTTPFKPHN